jgi:hypothetical protein
LSLCPSFTVTDHISHLHKATDKTVVPCILILIFRWQAQIKTFSEFNLLLIYSCMQFWFVNVVPRYFNIELPWKNLLTDFLLMRHEHTLRFLNTYFQTKLLTGN